jgi:hypothetical protein
VPQRPLDDLQVRAGGQGERRGAVAQVVQTDRWQAGLGGQLQEPVGYVSGMQLLPVGLLKTRTVLTWTPSVLTV